MSHALAGDGINFEFFNLLWKKSNSSNNDNSNAPILRLPDTVIFQFGIPQQWFFTSTNGGPNRDKTMILRKKRTNLTLKNIEDVFLEKARSRGDNDIVAYFIEKGQGGSGVSSCCSNIEYFSSRSLRDFLQGCCKTNKSGILQRFINPHGSRHNSQIRAMWTPKLCLQERRRTKQELHDARFALFERAITFDGPEIHSVSLPLRGTVLAGRIQSICTGISKHITKVVQGDTASMRRNDRDNASLGVARMVVNFKVDGNGRIWILWSDSVRLENIAGDNTSILSNLEPSSPLQGSISEPLNMDTLVELPPSTKLSQIPNHSKTTKLDNKMKVASCPSCGKEDFDLHFQAVTYKTIMQHFESTLEMLSSHEDSHPSKVWPPEDRFIKAAGGIGFGKLSSQLAHDREVQGTERVTEEESRNIPPVIRQVNPKLRVKGFQMYRSDPSFLLNKSVKVCEDCYLAYAKLSSSNFMMTRPIEITDATAFEGGNATSHPVHMPPNPKFKRTHKRNSENDTNTTRQQLFDPSPDIPAAITEPP